MNMTKQIFPLIAWLVFAALFETPAMGGRGLRHVRVIWQENPAREALISWTHDQHDKASMVYVDELDHGSNLAAYQYRQRVTKSKAFAVGGNIYYHTWLTNLKPSTTYYFTITSAGDQSAVFSFMTAPADGHEPFSLLFGGDSRSDRGSRAAMNDRMQSLLQQNPSILALVHGGDYIANGASWDQWEEWLDDHQSLKTDMGRLLPIIATRGNHEVYAELFNEVFGWPGQGNAYYVTRIADLAIVTLNTEISTSGEQKLWLDKTLSKLAQSAVWITTNYHRPAYPAVKLASDALQHWVPLFDKYLVDMAFESDGHTLKKTVPIRHNRRDDQHGVIYVGEGGLGVKQREPKHADSWYLSAPGYATAAHHVQQLTVSRSEMRYEVILMDGSLYDNTTLLPRVQQRQAPALVPSQPARLYNQALGHCLRFSDAYREDVAVHDACSDQEADAGDEFFVVEKADAKGLHRIRHEASDTCMTLTDDWLFMDRHKVKLLPCQAGNRQQTLQIKPVNFVEWQITDAAGKRCLHMGNLFRSSDQILQAYHLGCGEKELKEYFRFVTDDMPTLSN